MSTAVIALPLPSLSPMSLTISAHLTCLTGPTRNAIVKLNAVQMVLGALSVGDLHGNPWVLLSVPIPIPATRGSQATGHGGYGFRQGL